MTESLANPVNDLLPFETERFRPEYLKYFTDKRHNFKTSLSKFRGVWDSLQLLNDIWMREFSGLEHSIQADRMLPLVIFKFAHSKFLVAIELGFSCCVADSYSILRNGIEATAHAHEFSGNQRLQKCGQRRLATRLCTMRHLKKTKRNPFTLMTYQSANFTFIGRTFPNHPHILARIP